MTSLSRTRLPRVRHGTAGLTLALAALLAAPAAQAGGDTASNVLQLAMPVGVLAYELWKDNREGQWQFGESLVLTLGATEVLKHTVHERRPDGSDRLSFPSGDAASAFAAATFVHRRYGLEEALPLYAAASYVGYSRVHLNRHHWYDIVGSAALAAGSSWWLVTPKNQPQVSVVPLIGPHGVGIDLQASW